MKSYIHLLIALVLFALCPLNAQLVSQQRLDAGLNLALQYIQKNPNTTQADVIEALRQQLPKQFPELAKNPQQPPITEIESLRDYNQKFAAILNEKLPLYNDRQLQILALEKYPLYTKNTPVKIYYKKGRDVESWSGKIAAIEDGRVKVGSRYIAFYEMEGIEGNDLEILKFKPEETKKARAAYIKQLIQRNHDEREEFKKTQHKAVEKELIQRDRIQNEANGYTYYQNAWITPDALFTAIARDCTAAIENKRYEALNEKLKDRRKVIDAQIDSIDRRFFFAPPGLVTTPETIRKQEMQQKADEYFNAQVVARKQERERLQKEKLEREERAKQEKLAAEKAKKEAEEKARLEEEEKERLAKEEEERLAREAAAAEKAQRKQNLPPPAPEVQTQTVPFIVIVIAAIVFIIIIVVILFFVNKKRKEIEDKNRFSKYFEGKGKLQKDFWSKASSDPEHFKYVAYLFPSLKEATAALGKLSYIKTGPSGDLRCSRNLLFGVYEHLNGAVCFIGGPNFSYALWREASAVLPELPNAQYFKVSSEPIVQLELPDITKLAQEMHLHVEEISVEDVAGENGEFNRLYRYKSDNQQMALDFLENFNIHEAGIIVHVETPEGIFGKDENGVFTLEN